MGAVKDGEVVNGVARDGHLQAGEQTGETMGFILARSGISLAGLGSSLAPA